MTDLQQTQLGVLIGEAVKNDSKGLIAMLESCSVLIPSPLTSEKLVEITLNSLASSEKVQAAFLQFIGNKAGLYGNATGDAATGGGWFSSNSGAIAGVVSSGLNFFSGIQQAKANSSAIQAQANAQIAAGNAQVTAAQIAQQTALLQLEASKTQPKNSSTTLYVAIGAVSLIAVVGIIFALKK